MADLPEGDQPERLIGIDTNVLIDPVQKKPGRRKQVADGIVGTLSKKGAILSPQCITEFFNGTTSGEDRLLDRDSAYGRAQDLMLNFDVVGLTADDSDEAMELACLHSGLSVYDAQMLVVFSREGCRYFLTGDKAVARLGSYKGMEIVNPHEEGFDLDALLDSCREDVPAAPPAGDPVPPAPAGPGAAAVPEEPGAADGPGDRGALEVEDVPPNELTCEGIPEGHKLLESIVTLSRCGFALKFGEVTICAGHSKRQAQGDA